jgi:hypothetical protein
MIRLRNVALLIRDQLNHIKNGEDRSLRAQLPNSQVAVNIRILLIDFNKFFLPYCRIVNPALCSRDFNPERLLNSC